jgi:formylmethanofuran dehydrogenase subunit B
MTDSLPSAPVSPGSSAWTCPFCSLLCDHLSVQGPLDALALQGGTCHKAQAALDSWHDAPAQAWVDGRPLSHEEAISAGADLLRRSQQPLFGGLGTDAAGARALYRLACRTGAVCDAGRDAAESDALMHSLLALQDRGGFTTTLAEVRARADVIVFIGTPPLAQAPLLLQRLGLTGASALADASPRQLMILGGDDSDAQQLASHGLHHSVALRQLALTGDLFDQLAQLSAQLRLSPAPAPAPLPAPAPAASGKGDLHDTLVAMHSARYAVLVGTPAALPAHGALLVEAVHRVVNQLNQHTRAAALWIGGENGASTVNQVFTWLSGLPLRSRAGPLGLEHEPHTFSSTRLLQDGAVDCLLWVASWDAQGKPPEFTSREGALPLVLIGHPALARSAQRPGAVFIPVATPGLGSAGHLFRTDGAVLLPLFMVVDQGLPEVADVVTQLMHQLMNPSSPSSPS